MPELICQSVVKRLLKAGICYKDQKSLINYLNSQQDAPNWDIALVWIPELREKYWQTMVELQKELVPQHVSLQDLYPKQWKLFREVVLNKAEFHSAVKLQEKIDDFSTEIKRPLIAFDVIYEIRNFSVGAQHFTIGNVEIFNLTDEYLQSLDLTQTDVFSNWEGKFVAKVEVNASDTGGANDLGKTVVSIALNVLRLGVRKEFISRSSDSLFLWELGNSIVIPKVKPKEGILFSVFDNSELYPFMADLGNTIGTLLEDESVWKYILDEKLPKDISVRMQRAIEWISHSITSKSLDYKLVDLCTALEIMLLPNHKRRLKGELIALRQVLIGQGSSYAPAGILYLYEKRSNIIHSGALEITNYLDYWHLLICCLQVLESIVRLSQRYPDKWEMEDLLSIVENKETLENFIRYCELGMYEGKGISKIKKAAEERLAQCQ